VDYFASKANLKTRRYDDLENIFPSSALIMIPTGGTSGKIRFAIHTWQTLTASVRGFQAHFSLNSINSFCILPLYHVSGLMQFIRSLITGGKLFIGSYQKLKLGQIPDFPNADFFISLVPKQLQILLPDYSEWLGHFKTILLGGAPATPQLLNQARNYQLKLAPTYGMTETASQIVTLKPEEFLQGNNSSGKVLPHAQINCINQGIKLD
jgi:O-succinylbenzoic acid--CoA ligase